MLLLFSMLSFSSVIESLYVKGILQEINIKTHRIKTHVFYFHSLSQASEILVTSVQVTLAEEILCSTFHMCKILEI